jgi:adenylate kinase family enzyme
MMIHRIHILGASGSGTTTLGRALAERLDCSHFDTNDYFWLPTDPPFTEKRETTLRQQLLMDDLTAHDSWVLSGSLCGWGDIAIPLFELVVYLQLPTDIRMARLRNREHERYGERILPGGDLHKKSQEFLDWAASYDDGDVNMRRLSTLPCPVVYREGEYTIEEHVEVLMGERAVMELELANTLLLVSNHDGKRGVPDGRHGIRRSGGSWWWYGQYNRRCIAYSSYG